MGTGQHFVGNAATQLLPEFDEKRSTDGAAINVL
jgi:hypothetical protein